MPGAETISSAANPLVKEVRRALARGGLTSEGLCVAETFHLLEEAIRSGCEVPVVLASESARAAVEEQLRRSTRTRVVTLPDSLLQSLSATETSQGVIALVQPKTFTTGEVFGPQSLLVTLDGLQDPGNAGTILRAAEAFGAGGILFLKGSVSPYNPKTLRASAGSIFRLPMLHGMDAVSARELFEEYGFRCYAAVPCAGNPEALPVPATDLTGSCAIIIGNEARGVSAVWRDSAQPVTIPTTAVESLNASVAAGILLYEAWRQREWRR